MCFLSNIKAKIQSSSSHLHCLDEHTGTVCRYDVKSAILVATLESQIQIVVSQLPDLFFVHYVQYDQKMHCNTSKHFIISLYF